MITERELNNWFTYHSPTEEQIPKYVAIRDAGKQFALVILQQTPPSADQSSAIRHIRNAVMEANASIACEVDLTIPDDDKGVGRTPRELR